MSVRTPSDPASVSFDRAATLVTSLTSELGRVIIGQQRVVAEVLVCVLAGGHCLLRGVPGLAKTLLIKTLADAIDLKFSRIQFTPDLMPSDIIGTDVMEEDVATGKRHIRFIPGPVFANVILADEINRTHPRTQAALLEAMQEYQVTVGGTRYPLERPLFVLATENPIEQEGTHPLPEAQLDRFLFNVVIEYPAQDEERRIYSETTKGTSATINRVATGADLEAVRQLVRDLPAAANVVDAALTLVRSTRPTEASAPQAVREWIKWGAGPRAGQALLLGAKATALAAARHAPSCGDNIALEIEPRRHLLIM
jgi:MoxR-like ATPase